MTDREAYKKMLERSGHGWFETENYKWIYLDYEKGNRNSSSVVVPYLVHPKIGRFYDDLDAAFDEDGNLLALHSHVMCGSPTPALQAFIDKRRE